VAFLSLCLWLDRPIIEEPFVGIIGTEIHWVFNKSWIFGRNGSGQYLSLVISGAHRQVSLLPKALLALAERDLLLCFPGFKKVRILHSKVVKEPFATLSPVPGSEAVRPAPASGMSGFYFAGDWTRTGLPATIESAVLSGHRAAELILGGGA
jgi:zeta-carotene desaturase